MIYLASPYSHDSEFIRELRHRTAMKVTADLLREGLIIYSPIVHCHELSKRHDLPGEFTFWRDYCLGMLICANNLFVLTITGWNESVGVKLEMEFARENKIPIHLINEKLQVTPCE